MSDVDYQKLFENGQLVYAEPLHKDILDRMWQAYVGQPEEKIFRNKYRGYLQEFHPEALEPPVPAPVMPEPALPEEPADLSAPEAPPVEPEPQDVAPVDEVKKDEEVIEEKPKRGRGRRASSSPK